MTATILYNGDLRTTATHLQSGTTIITDAPTDNHGKGEAFSPTDLVATAMASCILTTMGIKAAQMGITIDGATAAVTKVMQPEPRRISEIIIALEMPGNNYSDKDKQILIHTADTCPVTLSLHPDLKKTISWIWL